jgi:hypothetical protein
MDGIISPGKLNAKLFFSFEKAELDRVGVGRVQSDVVSVAGRRYPKRLR